MKRTNKGMAFIMALFIVFTFCFSTPVNAAEENIKKVAVSNSLTGSKKTVNVAKGKTVKLNTVVTADAKADKTVKYKSANSKIASVTKAGVIKGIKVGKTKITVSSSKDPKKKATIKVTVKASAEIAEVCCRGIIKIIINIADNYVLESHSRDIIAFIILILLSVFSVPVYLIGLNTAVADIVAVFIIDIVARVKHIETVSDL